MTAQIGNLALRHGKCNSLSIEARSNAKMSNFAGFIGASSTMQFVCEQIGRIAASSAPVFITRESDTGQDVCAEALHAEGHRAGK